MGLFRGLEKFGLGKLEKMDVFEKEDKAEKKGEKVKPKPESKPKPVVNEPDLLFDKSFTCPVCDKVFRSKVIKTGKIKLVSQDTDLRPVYKHIDSIKYDVLVCPRCGYAALSRFYKFIMPSQAKMISENISRSFKGLGEMGDVYTYDDAIARYQLALACEIVKKAKPSEKAYTCLKMAWLYRGKAETLPEGLADYEKVVDGLKKEENSLLLTAYEGFSESFSKEDFPLCGMDELTVTYLVAELARRAGDYDESTRWISRILTSRNASERIKEKARHVKELIEKDRNGE